MPIRGHSGVQGGAEMGAYATALPRRRRRSTSERPRRCRTHWGFAVPAASRARPRARWSRRRARASSTCSDSAAATSSTCCPTRPRSQAALGARAAARPPGHRAHAPDARRPGDECSCCPPRPATSRRAAAPRPRPSGASCSARDPGPRRSARRAASGGSSPTWPRGCDPSCARPCHVARAARRIREEIARGRARLRGHRAACARRATRCSGAASTCAPAGTFPTPDGRARFTAVVPPERRRCPRAFTCRHPARQAVQLDGVRASRPAHRARTATRCSSPPRTRGGSAWGRATRCSVRSGCGEVRARAHVARIRARQRPDVLPGVQRTDPGRGSATRAACPTTTRSVEVIPAS